MELIVELGAVCTEYERRFADRPTVARRVSLYALGTVFSGHVESVLAEEPDTVGAAGMSGLGPNVSIVRRRPIGVISGGPRK